MYARIIALHSARTQSAALIGMWQDLAWNHATTEEARKRASAMARAWEQVTLYLTRRITHRPVGDVSEKTLYLADALVRAKSELAYRIDQGR